MRIRITAIHEYSKTNAVVESIDELQRFINENGSQKRFREFKLEDIAVTASRDEYAPSQGDLERHDMITRLERLSRENQQQESIKGTTSNHLDVTMKMPNTLTKREQFAMAAMQGMLGHVVEPSIPGDAISMADALIKELDK